ncbi:hypothetical protein ACJ41O_011717 [Fusarium nematophilum]
MKFTSALLTIKTGVLLLAIAARAMAGSAPEDNGCSINCALGYGWCKGSPYSYTCDSAGRLRHGTGHSDCETYCWCGCDEGLEDFKMSRVGSHAGIMFGSL